QRGAKVTLVAGHMEVLPPMFVDVVNVKSAADMFEAVTKFAPEQDIIVKAAAVADYTPVAVADNKIKKSDDDMKIELKRTKDILGYLGQHKRDGQVICGFSMETQDVIKNSEKKLTNKNCDMICANSLKTAGAGFKTDTNVITLITEGGAVELPMMTKEDAAHRILDELAKMI
uniref:phosphopantothenoylcysteine decarboxylase domain-containing protein n=2 Tax=Ruminococcus TaxID=1263 RepID=UPI003FEE43B0